MAKTKPIRIATSGNTIDGRHIDPVMLTQAAKNFNPVTYPALINLEHIPGVTGQSPFQSYGHIISLKTEEITLDVGGKPEKRVALMAELDVTDDLIALNQKGQKRYASIELYPDFAGSKEAYVGGLAVTDTPASLGTECMKLNRAKAFGAFVSEPTEFTLEMEPSAVATSEAESFMTGVKNFLTGFAAKPAETPAAPTVTPAAPVVAPDMAAFTVTVQEGFTKMFSAMEASAKANTAAVEKVSAELAAFKAEVEKAPANNYTQRPVATGGDGVIKADC